MDRDDLPHSRVDPELWFRSICSTPLLLAGIADLDGLVLDANELSVEGLGLARSDVVGQHFWDGPWWGTDNSVRQHVRELCAEAAESGGQVRAESPWWLPDGSERYVDLASTASPTPTARRGSCS